MNSLDVINTLIASLTAGMTTGHGPGSGTLTNGSGLATGSPITLSPGANTVTVTQLGTFTIVLPAGYTGTAASGSTTVNTSPVSLVAGSNSITTSAATGTITVTTHTVDDYYVKTWYTGDPLALPSMETPAGAVVPKQPGSRTPEFVGEDTVTDQILIRFYQSAMKGASESPETAAGLSSLIAMVDRAGVLLRTDPTFGSSFVNSDITGIDPMVPGVAGANVYRIAEITLTVKTRRLWGQ